jgi:hypothetical protein
VTGATHGVRPRWWTPFGEVEVGRDARGRWVVVLGGFSRSTHLDLRVALAEVCGERSDAGWLLELEQRIEADAQSRPG